MKIELEKIGPEGLTLDEPVTQAWRTALFGPGSEFQPTQDGRLSVHLTRIDDVVHLQGHAAFQLAANCSRCLEPVELHLKAPLEVTFVPGEPAQPALASGEVAQDDLGIATYVDREINLETALRDEILLDLPMRALCSADCAGLCARCGKNLNEGACVCEPTVDIRWLTLKNVNVD